MIQFSFDCAIANVKLRRVHDKHEYVRTFVLKEDLAALYDAYKKASSPWDGKFGIEAVLVPVAGSASQTKKHNRPVDDDLGDMPTGQRLKRS